MFLSGKHFFKNMSNDTTTTTLPEIQTIDGAPVETIRALVNRSLSDSMDFLIGQSGGNANHLSAQERSLILAQLQFVESLKQRVSTKGPGADVFGSERVNKDQWWADLRDSVEGFLVAFEPVNSTKGEPSV
jgi:hypothetical protein